MGFVNRMFSALGGILDIVGAPFRMIIELIRFPFLSKEGKEKQRTNLEKYDTRIREQFRKVFNMFDPLGLVSDDKGSWGSLYGDAAGKNASKEMGFNKESSNKSESISTSASYEDDVEVIDGQEVYDKGYSDSSSSTEKSYSENKSVNAVISGGSGGEDFFAGLYERG